MIHDLLDRLAGFPPSGVYAVIALLSALENIFPPVPADTAAALGAFLSARNPAISIWVVYGLTVVCNTASASFMFFLARRMGPALLATRLGRRFLPEAAVARVRDEYAHHHVWGIFVSRLLPVYRAVVPPFAGMIGVPASRALPVIALEAALYYGAIIWLAHLLGANWDGIARALGDIGLVLASLAVLATATLVWYRLRRRSARAA
jgi:membrane protein DedA with SNARE-associated domain